MHSYSTILINVHCYETHSMLTKNDFFPSILIYTLIPSRNLFDRMNVLQNTTSLRIPTFVWSSLIMRPNYESILTSTPLLFAPVDT